MSLTVNDALQNNSPKPLDNKYGIFSAGAFRPYASIAEANATIPAAYRSVGLTVVVTTVSGNAEYWYQGGIADGNLVAKGNTPSVSAPITFTGGNIGIQQSNGSQAGYLSSSDWTLFSGKLSGVASVGTGTPIYASTTSGTASIKSLAVGTGLSIADNGTTITLTPATISAVNIGAGAAIFTTNSGFNLQLRSVIGAGGITATQNANDITLSLSGQTIPTPVTTSNATPSALTSIALANGSAGMVIVTLVAVVSGNPATCGMAQRYAKYYKTTGGTLTIIETGDIIAESLSTLTTATWSLVSSSNNISVQITGEGTTNIKWSATIQTYTNS